MQRLTNIQNFHPTFALPIPIEEIVERKMKIALFAVPGVKLPVFLA